MLSLHLLVHVPCQSNAGRCTSTAGRCRRERANQLAASSICPPVDATHVLVESPCPPVIVNVVSVESSYCFPPLFCPTWHTLSRPIYQLPFSVTSPSSRSPQLCFASLYTKSWCLFSLSHSTRDHQAVNKFIQVSI